MLRYWNFRDSLFIAFSITLTNTDCWWWCLVAESYPTLSWCHGLQPSRLVCPWNFPGKNTGVGSHSFLQVSSWPRDWTQVSCTEARFFIVWITRDTHNTRDGCYFLLQGIFPTWGTDLSLLHRQADSLSLSHQESLWVLQCGRNHSGEMGNYESAAERRHPASRRMRKDFRFVVRKTGA